MVITIVIAPSVCYSIQFCANYIELTLWLAVGKFCHPKLDFFKTLFIGEIKANERRLGSAIVNTASVEAFGYQTTKSRKKINKARENQCNTM